MSSTLSCTLGYRGVILYMRPSDQKATADVFVVGVWGNYKPRPPAPIARAGVGSYRGSGRLGARVSVRVQVNEVRSGLMARVTG